MNLRQSGILFTKPN